MTTAYLPDLSNKQDCTRGTIARTKKGREHRESNREEVSEGMDEFDVEIHEHTAPVLWCLDGGINRAEP